MAKREVELTKHIRNILISMLLLISGCAQKDAAIYITSEPELAGVFSGIDGQYLGTTPKILEVTRSAYFKGGLAFPVIFERCGSPVAFKVISVDKWYNKRIDALKHPNTIHADVGSRNCG